MCVLGERLFAVGGYDGSGYLSLVESYDARLLLCSIRMAFYFFIVSECPPSCHKQRLEGNQERELRKGKRRAVFVSAGRLRP